MKRSQILITLIACATIACAQPTPTDFRKLNWLEGTWTRTNAKPGQSSVEQWTKMSDTEWRGTAVNMLGTDTTFVEKLKLIAKEGILFYVADVPENKTEVYFKFTELNENGFACENLQHDFPRKITYQRNGNKVKATISGDGKAIEYLFEKE